MKTLREWLNELPEPYNELAIANVLSEGRGLDREINSITSAINVFQWSSSPQGQNFWERIIDYYRRIAEIPDLERQMTNNMRSYYMHIEQIRNTPFPDCLAELERMNRELEETRLEHERQAKERVTYSASFNRMLEKLADASMVANRLQLSAYHTNNEANYISMRGEMCSFLPAGREHKTNPDTGKWLRDGRQEMKPAKLARKLLIEDKNTDLDATDFEKFANAVKSYVSVLGDDDGNGKNIQFKLVTGDDIRYYYYYGNYSELMGKDSNLWGSCMRSEDCQEYFDIYTENAEVCSLLVALDNAENVLGRALVWTFKDGKRGMDTIYAHESLFESFITWAVDNQAYYKDRQSCHHQCFDRLNRERVDYTPYVQLKKWRFSNYPYMDTLSILTEYGVLQNENPSCDWKILRDTGGGYEDGEDDDYVTLENGDRCHIDDAIYLEYIGSNGRRGGYYHESEVVFTERDEYRHRDDCERINGNWYETDDDDILYVDSRDEYFLMDDVIFVDGIAYHVDDCKCLHDGKYAHEDDCVQLHNGEWALQDDCTILHNGKYALPCDCDECEHTKEYYLHEDLANASDGSMVSNDNLDEYEELIKNINENENETTIA
jgi:hypothetical protein